MKYENANNVLPEELLSVIKMYEDKEQLEKNIKISTILLECNIPVAEIVLTKTGEQYASHNKVYFLMSSKLKGSNISDIKDREMARKMGSAIAQLHNAFLKCEKVVEFWDNNLLNGNFLFFEGNLSGCIDFDLSQKNIRIFDICYFLTGLLAEETENTFTQKEWLESVNSVIAGYEGITSLSEKEKNAIPCVMECIEILCAAYFISIKDTKCANDAYHIFHFVQDCESDINNAI